MGEQRWEQDSCCRIPSLSRSALELQTLPAKPISVNLVSLKYIDFSSVLYKGRGKKNPKYFPWDKLPR